MQTATQPSFSKRYKSVTEEKAGGVTYTPPVLADFVAAQIVEAAVLPTSAIYVLDPAIGDGQLLLSLLTQLVARTQAPIIVYGFDLDARATVLARQRLNSAFPDVELHIEVKDFLSFVSEQIVGNQTRSLFIDEQVSQSFDLIIANPPYVRTQIMGAGQAQTLASAFGLSGRVDLYHAFLIGMAQVLKPTGTAGFIVSNRFMTTKGAANLRAALRERLGLRHIWDLGDTKIFDAAVLPAVILAEGLNGHVLPTPAFTSIYETQAAPTSGAANPIQALELNGIVNLTDGRCFRVQHGTLDDTGRSDDLWRIATKASDAWLTTVTHHTWQTFSAIGKIRVGVKTCADKVFIRSDWDTLPEEQQPELLRPLMTHHGARRFRASEPKKKRQILYPHESFNGQRQVVDLSQNPRSLAYLENHRTTLEARTYLIQGGRRWYELWVPQDPSVWAAPKLVFRDISEQPTFWIDLDGSIVNGDCYWLAAESSETEPLLWLAAAVANSTFIEAFYDHRFNNKLYSGRRRFMTQYVEQFPLPDPKTEIAHEIIATAKQIYHAPDTPLSVGLKTVLDNMIWQAFGLGVEEMVP